MDHTTIPPIPHDLLATLDQQFPERSATLGDSIEKVMFEAGKRHVIRFLITAYTEQNRTVLSPEEASHVQT